MSKCDEMVTLTYLFNVHMMTLFAEVRFNPSPVALIESKNKKI